MIFNPRNRIISTWSISAGPTPGMKLTLSNDISLKPLFNPHPCEGTTVTFAEVAAHEIQGK